MQHFSLPTKTALLHVAFASPKQYGHWQIAPVDTSVREYSRRVKEGISRRVRILKVHFVATGLDRPKI